MLLDVWIQTFRAHIEAIAVSFGAHHRVPHFAVTAFGILTASTVQVDTVRVNEICRQVVVNIPVEFLSRTPRRAARRYNFDRMSAQHPVAEINRVNVLLHHLISANPNEGVPVSMLPL